MKSAKCTSCGANIEVNENSDAGVCPYCKNAYITEKAIQSFSNQTNNNAQVINNYYGTNPNSNNAESRDHLYVRTIPPKPKINVGLAILLCFFYLIPGLLYIGVKNNQIRDWEEKYDKYL